LAIKVPVVKFLPEMIYSYQSSLDKLLKENNWNNDDFKCTHRII